MYFKKNAPNAFEKTYKDIEKSKAYLKFCKKVHGTNFSCLNTLSQTQFLKLQEIIKEQKPNLLLDLGSGNGELTNFISKEFKTKAHGIDFSHAPNNSNQVAFIKGDIESYKRDDLYDLIISIDSFYMIKSHKKFLKNTIQHLRPKKLCALFFTLVNSSFNESPIRKALEKLQLDYEIIDYTQDDLEFWKKSRYLLDEMNDEFVDEGNFNLWNIKKKEADKNTLLHQNQETYRYLLIIHKMP